MNSDNDSDSDSNSDFPSLFRSKPMEMNAFSIYLGKENYPVTLLIVDDKKPVIEAIQWMLLQEKDVTVYVCSEPENAITMADQSLPTVILQDLVIPKIDGLTLLSQFRNHPSTRDVPVIILSAKDHSLIKGQAFMLGASDYLVNLPDKMELIARLRYHSNGYIRYLQRNEAYLSLERSQKALYDELLEAAAYVESVLPPMLDGEIKTSWLYIPSTELGGDAFGYHWIDPDHLAIYLLDVSGHGIGAALLSISVINILRSQTLTNTDFLDPSDLLKSLNETFPMEKNKDMFFTMWYGVYSKSKRHIVYASAGHPPAVLLTGKSPESLTLTELKIPGISIGIVEGWCYQNAVCELDVYNKLYIFSDGVYEIRLADGSMLPYGDFLKLLAEPSVDGSFDTDRILAFARQMNREKSFEDDFSLMQLIL